MILYIQKTKSREPLDKAKNIKRSLIQEKIHSYLNQSVFELLFGKIKSAKKLVKAYNASPAYPTLIFCNAKISSLSHNSL